jgi:hypothetical protein
MASATPKLWLQPPRSHSFSRPEVMASGELNRVIYAVYPTKTCIEMQRFFPDDDTGPPFCDNLNCTPVLLNFSLYNKKSLPLQQTKDNRL